MSDRALSAPGASARVVTVASAAGDSVVDDTTIAETAHANKHTFAANTIRAGQAFRVTLFMEHNCGAGPPTYALRLRFGGVSGTLLYNNGVFTPTASAERNFAATFVLLFTAVGASGTVVVAPILTPGLLGSQNQAAQAVTVDTTVSADLVATSQWTTNPANTHTATLHAMIVEALN